MKPKISVFKNIDALGKGLADWMTDYIQRVLQKQSRFTINLSGGNTPKKLYQLLASDPYSEKIDWGKLHVFWGDERGVPFSDEKNNARMAFDVLLDHVPVPASQIHIMRTDMDAATSAIEYEKLLHNYFDGKENSFDLSLLGLGNDAHTLSLFPGYPVIHENKKWVASFFVSEQNMDRITLTAPIVNKSKAIIFLVAGNDKAEAMQEVINGKPDVDRYPAQVIQSANGEVYWFTDEAAAKKILSLS